MTDPITSTITRARASYARFLPSLGTVARTSLTIPCRVSKAPPEWRPQGLPRYMRIPEWDLRFLFNADVKKGDTVAVTDATLGAIGTYRILLMGGRASKPGSYRVLTLARCLETKDEAGNDISVIDYTDTVVFAKNGSSNRPTYVTAQAYVSQLTLEDVQLFGPDAAGVKYKAIWDTFVHYGSDATDVPQEGHLIYISWLERLEGATAPFDPTNPKATNKGIPIHRPLKESGPVEWYIATFDDSA